ncbi:MAG: hypothetical protein JSW68_14495 [Burkholderiales bacterium]|nr:MAG: hypothetical protein JSW68_14495 [Burkholderiales bacterium]
MRIDNSRPGALDAVGHVPTWRSPRLSLFALLAAFALASCGGDEAPTEDPGPLLLEQQTVATLLAADIQATIEETDPSGLLEVLIGTPVCDVELLRVRHTTTGPAGEPTTASAALLLPRQPEGGSDCPSSTRALVAWSRATEFRREATLADPQASETLALASVFAAQGYAAVATDDLGLAASDLPYHPYLSARGASTVLIDAIRIARGALEARQRDTERLFVAGYSQGGHGAMATARELERNWSQQLPLLGTAAMTGPFALEDLLLSLSRSSERGATAALTYVLNGWQNVRGDLWSVPSDAFREPWADGIETLLPTTGLSEGALYAQGLLPLAVEDLLTESFLLQFETDPEAPARVAARQDSFYGTRVADPWIPQRPLFLCGGSADPVVPFWNAQLAFDTVRMAGAVVELLDVDILLGRLGVERDEYHVAAAIPCIIGARAFLERHDAE